VLYQIHQEGPQKDQIVNNRTKKIKLFNQATGLNVPTDSNSADLLTREITLEQFQASDSWKFAIVRRFCSNLLAKKKGQEKISGCITVPELLAADRLWIKTEQTKFLPVELAYLTNGKGSGPSLVSQLDLFLDRERVVRCSGRLRYAHLSKETEHPIFIPRHILRH
jgi:hypothetical protein